MSDERGCDDGKVDADSALLCPESGIDVQWEEALSPDLLAFAEHFLRHRKRRKFKLGVHKIRPWKRDGVSIGVTQNYRGDDQRFRCSVRRIQCD